MEPADSPIFLLIFKNWPVSYGYKRHDDLKEAQLDADERWGSWCIFELWLKPSRSRPRGRLQLQLVEHGSGSLGSMSSVASIQTHSYDLEDMPTQVLPEIVFSAAKELQERAAETRRRQ